jgi:CheY-like chemotaxis protein
MDAKYQELRVMIAEDNPINQKVLLRIPNRLGINNVVVADNQKAVDREATEPFDVVLMDMQMLLWMV